MSLFTSGFVSGRSTGKDRADGDLTYARGHQLQRRAGGCGSRSRSEVGASRSRGLCSP